MAGRPKRRARLEREARQAQRARRNASRHRKETGQAFDPNVLFDLKAAVRRKVRVSVHRRARRAPRAPKNTKWRIKFKKKAKLPFEMVPRYYIHMHTLEKIGFNPHATYMTTPTGVYGYPLDAKHYKLLMSGQLPFLANAKHVSILELTQPQDCLVTARHTLEQVLYRTEKKRAKEAGRGKRRHNTPTPGLLRQAIIKEGYTSVYDPGTGAIHENEPAQMVFLTPSSYRKVITFTRKSLVRSAPPTPKALQLQEMIRWLRERGYQAHSDGNDLSSSEGDEVAFLERGNWIWDLNLLPPHLRLERLRFGNPKDRFILPFRELRTALLQKYAHQEKYKLRLVDSRWPVLGFELRSRRHKTFVPDFALLHLNLPSGKGVWSPFTAAQAARMKFTLEFDERYAIEAGKLHEELSQRLVAAGFPPSVRITKKPFSPRAPNLDPFWARVFSAYSGVKLAKLARNVKSLSPVRKLHLARAFKYLDGYQGMSLEELHPYWAYDDLWSYYRLAKHFGMAAKRVKKKTKAQAEAAYKAKAKAAAKKKTAKKKLTKAQILAGFGGAILQEKMKEKEAAKKKSAAGKKKSALAAYVASLKGTST